MNDIIMTLGLRILAALSLCAFVALPAIGDEPKSGDKGSWTQWRGPTRDSKAANEPKWPDNLKGLRERWRVKLSPGYSGPIVANDRVYIAETRRKQDEIVRAFDCASGKHLWKVQWAGAMSVPFFAKSNGDWIRSTPALDGDMLYVGGMRDVLVAIDVKKGREAWRVDFTEQFKSELPTFGFVSSPLVMGDFVYVQAGGGFVKLDKKTGKPVWRVLTDGGGMNGSAFSSPVAAHLLGRSQILVQTREKLCGVDPDDGMELWSQVVPSYRGMNILTPTVFGDGIFTSTHKNRTFFYSLSKDQAGMVSVKEAWTNKAQGYMSSPVVIGDFAYLHLGNGRLSCMDLRTGEERWRTKSFGQYWSLAVQDDKVLALDENGELILFRASPDEFKLLDRREVTKSESWAHVAVCGGEVFVRDLKGLSVFEWSAATEAAQTKSP